MFSKLLSFFSLKRKFSSTEETTTNVDESIGRPTKRVRIEKPSSTHEADIPQYAPVQAACTINDEDEEMEVLDEILPRKMKGKEVERVEETRVIAARLREGTVQSSQDEPMAVLERTIRALPLRWHTGPSCIAPLPLSSSQVPRASPSSPTYPAPPFELPTLPQEPRAEFILGPANALPPQVPCQIFILPPRSRAGPSRPTRSPTFSPTSPRTWPRSEDCSSNATILVSLQQIRRQFAPTPSAPHSEGEVDEGGDDDIDSEDEDLPLITAMMQVGNPPPNPESHREYPVYVEDLDLEDGPLEAKEDTRAIIYLDDDDASMWSFTRREGRGLAGPVDEDEEDEETPEERLQRLVREGEAEDLP